jgi:hypothetical protein
MLELKLNHITDAEPADPTWSGFYRVGGVTTGGKRFLIFLSIPSSLRTDLCFRLSSDVSRRIAPLTWSHAE